MAKTDWYFIGFILTVIAAGLLWGLAVAVYRNNRKNYLNRTFALAIFFMGIWMLSGFSEKILNPPNDAFTLWTFRWAYFSGLMTAVLFFLFALGLYLDHPPKKELHYLVFSSGIAVALLSFSPYVVKSATYQDGVLSSRNGPLFAVAALLIVAYSIGGILLLYRKWANSAGIDRARISVVFFGLAAFFPFAAFSIFVLPLIAGNDFSTSYAYLAGIIPVVITSYAIIRLRLLDVRIILRRTSVFLIGSIVMAAPLILLIALFNTIKINRIAEDAILISIFILLILLAPSVLAYFRRLSSRLFFSELYDELQLLDVVSSRLTPPANLQSGLISALSEIVLPLGLENIGVVIPPGVINESCWRFKSAADTSKSDGNLREQVDENYRFPAWLNSINNTVVTEELQRWPKELEDRRLGDNLDACELSACLPIKVLSAKVGYIVLGRKATKGALSATDISFLEKVSERLGLFIDNYALSAKLGTQLKELQQVYADLNEAYEFKSEIIQVTSHEFRTPITLVNGFALTLKEGWTRLEEEEKLSFLDNIVDGCDRITNLTDQFFRVSNFEEGRVSIDKMPVKTSLILRRLCASILPEEQERLIIEADPEMYLFSDPEHLNAILKNVVENALRFSPADQSIIIRAWRNSVHDYIQVQDFGDGIPSDELERIFEPFVRLESLAHHSRGMGLGLYIVRLLSSKLGIEVEIDCSDGNGTTVTLSIPL